MLSNRGCRKASLHQMNAWKHSSHLCFWCFSQRNSHVSTCNRYCGWSSRAYICKIRAFPTRQTDRERETCWWFGFSMRIHCNNKAQTKKRSEMDERESREESKWCMIKRGHNPRKGGHTWKIKVNCSVKSMPSFNSWNLSVLVSPAGSRRLWSRPARLDLALMKAYHEHLCQDVSG